MPSRRHRAAVEALALAVDRLLYHTPGHTAARVTIGKDENGIATINAIATGWSSSLSRRPLITEHRIGIQDWESDDAPALAAAALGRRLATARWRQALATTHGLRVEHGAALDATLLLIDRATAAILAERGVDPLAAARWHRRSTAETGVEDRVRSVGDYRSIGPTTITLANGETVPTLSIDIDITGSGGTVAGIRDNVVGIAAAIPDTLLAAAIGRPLGALVATRIPHLDARTVVHTSQGSPDGCAVLTLAPDRITVGEAQAITPLPLATGTSRRRRTEP